MLSSTEITEHMLHRSSLLHFGFRENHVHLCNSDLATNCIQCEQKLTYMSIFQISNIEFLMSHLPGSQPPEFMIKEASQINLGN